MITKAPKTLTVAGLGIPTTREEIAAEFVGDAPVLALMRDYPAPVNEAELVQCDEHLTAVARLRDELVARRQEPVKRIKSLITEWESWWRDYIAATDAAITGLKRAKGAFLAAKDAEARAARDAARAAAAEGDSAATLTAIQTAQALEVRTDADMGTRFVWEIKRIARDLLPDEWWIPDVDAIAAAAKAAGDDPPTIPGVIFERVAVVQARRK